MTKTLRASIVDFINHYNYEPGIVYVLSGFNYFLNELDVHFFLPQDSFICGDADRARLNASLTLKLLANDTEIILTREQFYQAKGLLEGLNKRTVVINNDLYVGFTPNYTDPEIMSQIGNLYDSESDETIDGGMAQQIYDEVIEINNEQFVRYSDLAIKNSEIINITDAIRPMFSIDESLQLQEDVDIQSITEAAHLIVKNNVGVIYYYDEAVKNNVYFAQLQSIYAKIGVSFRKKEFQKIGNTIPEDRKNSYLDILQRIDNKYTFRSLSIYENPYESTKLISIGQEIIIDDIVSAAIKAKQNQLFNDVFVTAPTGAGKSVMFQIPAIYLAEHYDYVTIVISPLIALMNDQIKNIANMTDRAVSINGSYTPIEKEEAIRKVKEGEKSILYLAPEALISHANIDDLIGDRKIGLVVIDEAHVVATWGKNFRPDCWYLGDYLNKLRRGVKAKHSFPIVTFTATATFGTNGSMYDDIVNSLYMTPHKYIGCVKRDDISFDIRVLESNTGAYKEEKDSKAIQSIKEIINTGDKCITYTPYVSQAIELNAKLQNTGQVCMYYSDLEGDAKQEAYAAIKDGTKRVILCTKAFGMGVDISDIKYVYHFAPTGTIADYVQEIGRAARLPGMKGIARTDYFKKYDFKYINQLYGMSKIRNDQIVQCINKILSLYRKNGHRNFMVSSEDFSYIFEGNEKNDKERISNVDNKLKTALLMIKKDFEINPITHNFAPIIFKPRSMFVYGYFAISDNFFLEITKAGFGKYFKNITNRSRYVMHMGMQAPVIVRQTKKTYELNYRKIWEEKFRKYSFADFKRRFNTNQLSVFNFRVGEELGIVSIVNASLKKGGAFIDIRPIMASVIDGIRETLDMLKMGNSFFSMSDLSKLLINNEVVKNKRIADALSSLVINMLPNLRTNSLVSDGSFIAHKKGSGEDSGVESYRITNNSYISRLANVKKNIYGAFNVSDDRIFRFFSRSDIGTLFVFQILDILELANVEIKTGDRPEYFIRVNNPSALERIISNEKYYSYSVDLATKKHKINRELMRVLFEDIVTDADRWNFIEQYFLGRLDEREYLITE